MSKPILGLCAEYNPFHAGHSWQLNYAKTTLDAEYVVVVMSGDFTQRGIPAIMDKYERTALALKSGADMVIEIPTVGATASAEIFARTAVGILKGLGFIDGIIFGAETPDSDLFNGVAKALLDESFMFKKALNAYLKEGNNFAKARALALSESTGCEDYTEFLEAPNNILGIEYVKALRFLKSGMGFTPIKRQEGFSSSTSIRSAIRLHGPRVVEALVPDITYERLNTLYQDKKLAFINDFSILLHRALISNRDFEGFLDSNPDLSNRTLKLLGSYIDTKDFARAKLKSKNLTLTHIMRYLTHIMLDVTYSDYNLLKSMGFAPYAHILGVKTGSEKLISMAKKRAHIPVFVSYKEATELLNEKETLLYKKDLYASDLYGIVLTNKSGTSIPNERSAKLISV